MSYVDLDNQDLAPSGSDRTAKITTAGVNQNVKFLGVELIDKPADPEKKKKAYVAAEFTFENQDGEQHKELYFQPPTSESEIKFTSDKFDDVNGKKIKTRKMTEAEMLKVSNNEFIYFLLDLAEALGYPETNVKAILARAKDFKDAVALFKKSFPANKRTINMRLLWDNNKKKETSFLKLHYKGILYYPYKTDIFETHIPDRKSGLFISEWEYNNCMKPQFENKPSNSNAPVVNEGGAPVGAGADNTADDEDPF